MVMPDAVGSVNQAPCLGRLPPVEPRRPHAGQRLAGLGAALSGLVSQVSRMQHEASDAITQFAAGDGDDLHEVMAAVGKAELSFKFLMETRNKLVEAYQEAMRTQH